MEDLNIFYSDVFRILSLIKETTQKINDVEFSPISYEDIGKNLNITRQTVSKHINLLKDKEYIKIPKRGKIQITEKGKEIIKKLS